MGSGNTLLHSNAIAIKTIDKASGLIYSETEYTSVDIRNMATCGWYESERPEMAWVKLNIFVTSGSERKSTTVTLNTRFSQSWSRQGIPSGVRPCESTGKVEREIREIIREYRGLPSDDENEDDGIIWPDE